MNYFVGQPWNSINAVKEAEWLCATRSESDKDAIHATGNIVVPQQAFTAMCILTELSRGP